jgi:hypothetical protein
VHLPLAGYIGYAASHEARLGSTYVELPTDPPQSTYVNFTHTQGEIPGDRQLAAQPLEGSQDSTVLTLAKLSREEQQSLCEQLQLIRDQLAQMNLILDRMDQCDKENNEWLKLVENTSEPVILKRDMEQPVMVPTTERDQPSFVNDLYHPNKNNITTTTWPLTEANIAEQPQIPILMTTELSLNNDKVMYWNISPTIHDCCFEAHNIGNIPCPQDDKDQDLTGGRHH